MNKLNIRKKLQIYALTGCMILSPMNINKTVYAKENTSIEKNDEKSSQLFDLCEKYGQIYSIKPEILLDYIEYKTNTYTDLIDDNWEKTVIYYAQELYYDSKDNYYYEKITTNIPYEVELSPEELVEKYSEILESNKYIAMAIGYAECLRPIEEDWNYKTNGNIGGISYPSHFENAEIGIIYYIIMLKDNYGVNEDSDESILSNIASTYCPPNAYNWEYNLVGPIYKELKNNGYYSRATEETQNKVKQKKSGK